MQKTIGTMLAIDVVPEAPRPQPLFADFVRTRAAVRPGDPHVLTAVHSRTTIRIGRISIWRRIGRRLRSARF